MRGEVQELPPEYGYVLMLGASKQHFQGSMDSLANKARRSTRAQPPGDGHVLLCQERASNTFKGSMDSLANKARSTTNNKARKSS